MLDLNSLNSRKGSDIGRDLHIVHPVTGEPMYNDSPKNQEPLIVVVLGTESVKVQKLMREINRAKMKGDKEANTAVDDLVISEIHDRMREAAKPLIAGFKNVFNGDVIATAADAEWFLDMQMVNGQDGQLSFVEQVVAFASKRANFLGNVSSA